MSSLAQLADLLGDDSLMMRVKAFYDNGLWEMRDEIGWSPESVSQQESDHGETNNTGDILETALILGQCGYSEYYTSAVRVQSPYTHDCLSVKLRQPGPLFVRIPSWLTRDEVQVEGNNTAPIWTNGYLFFNELAAGQMIRLRFPLKERRITLSARLHIRPIRVKMRGDTVRAMDNFGADLTFFAPYE